MPVKPQKLISLTVINLIDGRKTARQMVQHFIRRQANTNVHWVEAVEIIDYEIILLAII